MKNTLLVILFCGVLVSSQAQSPCEEVIIESVTLNGFDMGLITVVVTNNSAELFDYPGFRIYNAETNELIGEEEVNFFGIAQTSVHQIPHNLGEVDFDDSFSLRLDLWSGFYTEMNCQFEVETILRPSSPCFDVNIGVNLTDIADAADSIYWELHNDEGSLIDSDGFILDPLTMFPFDVTCLLPGCYELTFRTADNVPNLGYMAYVSSYWFGDGGFSQVEIGQEETSFTFSFFENCGIDGVEENELKPLVLYPNPTEGDIFLPLATMNQLYQLYDLRGSMLLSGFASRSAINLNDLPAGIYILQMDGYRPVKILHQ